MYKSTTEFASLSLKQENWGAISSSSGIHVSYIEFKELNNKLSKVVLIVESMTGTSGITLDDKVREIDLFQTLYSSPLSEFLRQ